LLGAWFVSNDAGGVPSPAPGYVAAALSFLATLAAIVLLPESLKSDAASRPARKCPTRERSRKR